MSWMLRVVNIQDMDISTPGQQLFKAIVPAFTSYLALLVPVHLYTTSLILSAFTTK